MAGAQGFLVDTALNESISFSGESIDNTLNTAVAAGETLILHLEGTESNGGSLLVGTGTVFLTGTNSTFVEADSGTGFSLTQVYNRVSVDSVNINPNEFRTEFKFKRTAAPASYGKFFVVDDDTTLQFNRAASDTAYSITYNGVIIWSETAGVNLWDGTAWTISVQLDNATDTVEVKINGDVVVNDVGAVTWPTDIGTTTTLMFGNRPTEDRQIGGLIGDIKVYALD
jgi:hypothetical protein